jgi:hypothetical protein
VQRIQDLPPADPNTDPLLSLPGHPRVVPSALLLTSKMLQLAYQVPRQGLVPSGGSFDQRGMHFVWDVTDLDNLAHNASLAAMHADCTHTPGIAFLTTASKPEIVSARSATTVR